MQPAEIQCVSEGRQAEALLNPLRARILTLAREPVSATQLGILLELPRQRVNYHVRHLERAGLLRRAGRRRKRNMFEQRYVASARGYVISPELLGEAGADWRAVSDAASAGYVLALSAQMQADVARAARAVRGAGGQARRLPTLSIKSQFRFESPEQREQFARELKDAVVAVIARFTAPHRTASGKPGPGRPYRLVLGCYPYAPEEETGEKD